MLKHGTLPWLWHGWKGMAQHGPAGHPCAEAHICIIDNINECNPISRCLLKKKINQCITLLKSVNVKGQGLEHGCPNYGPRSIFNWPATNSKNIIEYVSRMKQALDCMYISVLTLGGFAVLKRQLPAKSQQSKKTCKTNKRRQRERNASLNMRAENFSHSGEMIISSQR